MKHSEDIKDIAVAIGKVQQALPVIDKDETANVKTKTGADYSYQYISLPLVWTTVKEELAKNKLTLVQGCELVDGKTTITTLIAHETGQWVEFSCPMPIPDAGPQAVGSAITYGRRYGLMSALGIFAADDDDGAAAQATSKPAPTPPPPSSENMATPKGVKIITSKVPVKEEPEPALGEDGEPLMYHNESKGTYAPVYICPNCGRQQSAYEKDYKGTTQVNFSCSRHPEFGDDKNCGYWASWDKE